jgi:hypothetical protein
MAESSVIFTSKLFVNRGLRMALYDPKENEMKKIVVYLLMLCLAVSGFSVDLNQYKNGIEDFAEDLATILPLNSTIGLNWNDAYIGQIIDVPPHFGLGITMGAITIPAAPIKDLVGDAMGGDTDDIPSFVRTMGVPIPAAVIDARIGGFLLPFDAGLKFGYLKFDVSDVKVDYLLLGGDVRYCVLEQLAAIPKISVGAGFNYMKTDVTLSGALGNTRSIEIPAGYGSYSTQNLMLTSPDLYLETETKVIDFKVQASWNLLVIEPSIGFGASYGMSRVSAGAESTLYLGGTPVTPTDVAALEGFGFDADGSGIGYTKTVNAMSYRAFGGLGFLIPFCRIDIGLIYGFNSKSLGATLGGRFQL